MDKLDILERYYNAFINLENPKDFFIGLGDYLEFADSVTEFDRITGEILAQRKSFEEKLEVFKAKALEKISAIKKELFEYVSREKIQSETIGRAFKDYEDWLSGRTDYIR